MLYYSILSVYQSTFEVDLYGAAVLGVDAPLFYAIQLVTQLFWLGSAFFIVSLDAFVVPHYIKLWVIAMFIARNILTVRAFGFLSIFYAFKQS